MDKLSIKLNQSHKVYFASDFHLGAPDSASSRIREQKIVRWLNHIENDAAAIFLLGDIFDFWFEYPDVVPKGYIRFFGKLADLKDKHIPIYFFRGNHDLWMFDYFEKELEIPIYKNLLELIVGDVKMLIGHGDGLGPGDRTYKFLKKVFTNPIANWLFKWLHPSLGFALAKKWSSNSRLKSEINPEKYLGEDEWLFKYSQEIESSTHYDYYIFGHRHMVFELNLNPNSKYLNIGDWVTCNSFASYDGKKMKIEKFDA